VRSAGETGQLYGSVSTRDIADLVTAEGFSVNRNQVELNQPIKMIGVSNVAISLHPEVEVT
jgi:large subunit ribosomal protein L9